MVRHMFRRPVDVVSSENSGHGRHSNIRMVYTRVDFRIERDPMLRGHLSGREQNAQRHTVLDEFHVLHHFHHRAYA